MTIQHRIFEGGGFVLHKLPLGSARRCSAWFDAAGKPLDAEIFDRVGRVRPMVENGGPIWKEIEAYGAQFVATRARRAAAAEAAHADARAFMDRRPDLRPMSLDEWLMEHHEALSAAERDEGHALLKRVYETEEAVL